MNDATESVAQRGFCVIMAGGRGTRFWPLSRASKPKQLLPLAGSHSLLRETFDRVEPLVGAERILVVTNAGLVDAVAADLPGLPTAHIIGETVGRNTAPCAALGMAIAQRLVGPVPVALLAADHLIPDTDRFRSQLTDAFAAAAAGDEAITFGIPPATPETGFGYIEVDGEVGEAIGPEPVAGKRFVEKPDLAAARAYVAGGRHFWNSGIFVWRSDAFAAALAEHLPEVEMALAGAVEAFGGGDFPEALDKAYADCPAQSIDVGVMEKVPGFRMIRADFRWSDLGSWPAWGEIAGDLGDGNRGDCRLVAVASRNNILRAPGKCVALVGVDDLVVVDTDDALLVCRADEAQRIREVTGLLAESEDINLL